MNKSFCKSTINDIDQYVCSWNYQNCSCKIGDSGVIRVEGEETINELLGGVKLHQQDISAPIDCTGDYYYKYDSQYLETMAGGEGVKIVSWSYRNAENGKWQV